MIYIFEEICLTLLLRMVLKINTSKILQKIAANLRK